MNTIKNLILIFSLFSAFAHAAASEADEMSIKLLTETSPDDYSMSTKASYEAAHPVLTGKFLRKDFERGKASGDRVLLLIDSSIYDSISADIGLFVTDLEEDGFDPLVYTTPPVQPESIRAFLYELYFDSLIEGAFLIGDIPSAWFQIKNDFEEYGYKEWPMDYFYMELDGSWLDLQMYDAVDTLVPGTDGIYDDHDGDLMPEIYVGRLIATGMSDPIGKIRCWFEKDRMYRNGDYPQNRKALLFIDDDWAGSAAYWASNICNLFPDTEIVADIETTTAENYRTYLSQPHTWVSLFAHSWPGGHGFYSNGRATTTYYWATEYLSMNPPAAFYNFFCCSFARFTDDNFGSGLAILAYDYSLCSVGSSKTGSMLSFDRFYNPMASGRNIGEAFSDWFAYIATDGFSFNELCWHAGMTLQGDPFLYVNTEYSAMKHDDTYKKEEKREDSSWTGIRAFMLDGEKLEHAAEKNGADIYNSAGIKTKHPSSKGIYFLRKRKGGDSRRVMLF